MVGAIDLEQYEYSPKSQALIRATEGTIEERIPPRLKIRKDADITAGLLLLEMTFPSVHFNLVALGIKHSLIIGIIKLKHRNKAKCNNKPLILLH